MWALTTTLRVELRRAKCGDCFAMCTDVMPVASLTAAPAPRPRPRVEGPRGRGFALAKRAGLYPCFFAPPRTSAKNALLRPSRPRLPIRPSFTRRSSSRVIIGPAQNYWRNGRHSLDVKRRQGEHGRMKASIARAAVEGTYDSAHAVLR